MPFKKGQSGNPGGRRRAYTGFKQRCAEFMDAEGFEHLLTLARARNEFALRLLTEYAYGKPTQPIAGDADAAPLNIRVVFDDGAPAPTTLSAEGD